MSEQGATPRSLGFRMPAEWEEHGATFLTWPREEGISFPGRFERIPRLWAELTRLLAKEEAVHIHFFSEIHRSVILEALKAFSGVEPIKIQVSWKDAAEGRVLCATEEARERLVERIGEAGERLGREVPYLEAAQMAGTVWLHPFPAYEPWCRDHGPIFLRDAVGHGAIVDWDYNAWGGKYPPYDLDDAVPTRVAEFLGLPVFYPRMIMEGGALEVDGEGTVLTTRSCLLNPNRNPQLTQEEIERALCEFLGVEKVLWLGDGIEGDDTDGHVDDLTRFVSPGHVVTVMEPNESDANHAPLAANYEVLQELRDARGRELRVTVLPMPAPRYIEGQRVPASYANYYVANGQVLVPVFGDEADDTACAILAECFPDRKVIPFDATDLIWGLGALHCITQQMPRLVA